MLNAVWYSCMQTQESHNKTYRFGFSIPNLYDHNRWFELEYKQPRTPKEQAEWEQLMDVAIDIKNTYLAYKKLPIQQPPITMYTYRVPTNIHQDFKGFFKISDGYKILTQPCYELLQQFKLAKGTQFFPLRLYDQESNQPLNNETYYLMNLTESSWRSYLMPKSCEGELCNLEYLNGGVQHYFLCPGDEFDHAIAVSSEALSCNLDLWHDPALKGSMFMSDRLKQALAQANFLEAWYVLSTQIIYKN